MSWFWFWWGITALMIVADVGWWYVAMHLVRRKAWRILITVFAAVQLAAHLSATAGVDWPSHTPKAVLVAIIVWHYFGVLVLLPLGSVCAVIWIARRVARSRKVQPENPAAVSAGGNLQTRRQFIGAAAVLVPPLFTVGLTGAALAQLGGFRLRRFTLPLPALPRALDGITIAHVTDIHVGWLTCGKILRELVRTTNELRADLVLLTGDLIDYKLSDLSEGIALVKAMESRCGTWMIEGNHDLFDNGSEFERRVKASGIPLLRDETAVTDVRGHPVQLFGLSWLAAGNRQRDRLTDLQLRGLMRHRQPDAFPILLAHHPHAFDAAVKADLPLTLAGHTHGGQLMLNSGLGVGSVMFRYWSGLYTRGGSRMIVSNGIGNWFPLRFNAPAEIVHITLRCAAA